MIKKNYLSQLKATLEQGKDSLSTLEQICIKLQSELDHFDWVGFYFMNHQTKKLHLGPYAGKPTDHKIIDFGSGICGQVAVSGETYLSSDVSAEENYIACSIDVKSEIVVPLHLEGKLVGQIDIDSNTVNAFNEEDQQFLVTLNESIAKHLGADLKEYIESFIDPNE